VKTRISLKQLSELSQDATRRLWEWWQPQPTDEVAEWDGYVHFHAYAAYWFYEGGLRTKQGWIPLLTIWQCRAFLKDHHREDVIKKALRS
jgi:hypothetical protein